MSDKRIQEYQWYRKSDRQTVSVSELTFDELREALCDSIDCIEDVGEVTKSVEALRRIDDWRTGAKTAPIDPIDPPP